MDISIHKLKKFSGFEPDYRLVLGGYILRISQTEANDLLAKLLAITQDSQPETVNPVPTKDTPRKIDRGFLGYFLSLDDNDLREMLQDITGKEDLSRYTTINRLKHSIVLSDLWDRIEVTEGGIVFHPDSTPPYKPIVLRQFDNFFYIPEPMTLDEMIAEYQWCQDNSHIWYYDCVSNYATWLKKKIDRLKGLQ
jgi:hypothetical protein